MWGTGYGGMLTITLFNIVGGELEGAWQGSDVADTSIVSVAAKAYLGPSIGPLRPLRRPRRRRLPREPARQDATRARRGLVFAGAKLKFPFGLVIRGEYQWLDLPDEVLLPLDNRYLFAVGLSF